MVVKNTGDGIYAQAKNILVTDNAERMKKITMKQKGSDIFTKLHYSVHHMNMHKWKEISYIKLIQI